MMLLIIYLNFIKIMKKTYLFLFLPALLLILSGCGNTNNQTSTSNNTNKSNIALTMTELAKHSSKGDCWQLINGQVYDLSAYTASNAHPGGDMILKGCGQDATAMFESIGKHQGRATAMLPDFLLGSIQK